MYIVWLELQSPFNPDQRKKVHQLRHRSFHLSAHLPPLDLLESRNDYRAIDFPSFQFLIIPNYLLSPADSDPVSESYGSWAFFLPPIWTT
jgi:hypothetical protein